MEKNIQNDLDNFLRNKEQETGKPFDIITYIKSCKEFFNLQPNGNILSDCQYEKNKEIANITFDFILTALEDFNITEDDGAIITYRSDINGAG